MNYPSELELLIKEVKTCDKICGIILYGSSVYGKENPSDIDIIICSESNNYSTPKKVYEIVAKNTTGKITPTIKSIKEFNSNNFVSMYRRYIQHLHNVGKVVYEKPNINLKERISNLWNTIKEDSRIISSQFVANSLKFRHLYYFMNTNEYYINNFKIRRPSKFFWQGAVDLLKINISKKEENKIVEKFYEKIPCGKFKEIEIIEENILNLEQSFQKKGLTNEIKNQYIEQYYLFKNIIERDMWELNKKISN